jgi:hypothetical protein
LATGEGRPASSWSRLSPESWNRGADVRGRNGDTMEGGEEPVVVRETAEEEEEEEGGRVEPQEVVTAGRGAGWAGGGEEGGGVALNWVRQARASLREEEMVRTVLWRRSNFDSKEEIFD